VGFTASNFVVLRVGDGISTLSASLTAGAYVDECVPRAPRFPLPRPPRLLAAPCRRERGLDLTRAATPCPPRPAPRTPPDPPAPGTT
jgi:hypothetical protein